jgi:hypothetical protein
LSFFHAASKKEHINCIWHFRCYLLRVTDAAFYIALSIKTANGFENFGQFFLGNNKDAAYSIFKTLKGNSEVSEADILHAELTETKNDLPVNIEMISCTLKELAENCRIITKAAFKRFVIK